MLEHTNQFIATERKPVVARGCSQGRFCREGEAYMYYLEHDDNMVV